ncbi:MAG TPA: MFS transporter [Gaiellaceae bacterium]|nr:MFS transporter [Gaiellaceae bacterium]
MDGTGSHPRLTLAVLSLGGLAYAVLSSAVVPALPTIQHDLGASETGITFLLTGYLLSASVGTAILGRLGDMFGKERVLVWTLVILAAGTLLAAVAHSLPLLIAARVVQGVGGGIFPLSFGIIRDEFPPERVAGGIGLISAILGVGGGVGIVVGGLIVDHLGWQWLFWLPLAVTVVAAVATWRLVPESPVRVPGRVNWAAAALMSTGISAVLIGISEATSWGWGSARTLGLIAAGLGLCAAWVAVESASSEPLIDMAMMRSRGVWTANLVAFLLGAGMYSMFFVFPQFAQLPASTGFGFGASVVVSGLYLLPSTLGVVTVSPLAGVVARRFGSKAATIAGSAVTAGAFALITLANGSPWEMLVSSTFFGIGIGLAFAALGNLVVEAVDPHQTGAAGGMNTVMRTMGGALGGQLAATFIAGHTGTDGNPALTGFVQAFAMATAFLVVCTAAGLLIPRRRPFARPRFEADSATA